MKLRNNSYKKKARKKERKIEITEQNKTTKE